MLAMISSHSSQSPTLLTSRVSSSVFPAFSLLCKFVSAESSWWWCTGEWGPRLEIEWVSSSLAEIGN